MLKTTKIALNTSDIEIGAIEIKNGTDDTRAIVTAAGALLVSLYAAAASYVSGVTAALTDTTSTQVLAAPATGLRNYITSILVTNSHATVSTFVTIRDGNGGTILWEGYALAAGGGFSITFPTPLRQPTLATRLDVKCETTSANVIASVAGFTAA